MTSPDTGRPGTRPKAIIQTRLPASGLAARLTAITPARRWTAPDSAQLLACLPGAIRQLETTTPRGLLIGLLPYPDHARHAAIARATPATLLLFDEYRLDDAGTPSMHASAPFHLTTPFTADWPREEYVAAVQRVQQYLSAGDAYQVNLAQRFTAFCTGDPWPAFELLRQRFSPPYAAWIDLGDRQIISMSPESFLDVDGARVVTRPIKGTRPRGQDPEHDARLAADLASHPKDRAENLMIVDLLRNDLGQVCIPGSIRTPALFEVESFHNVHHLVSTVEGRLRRENGIPDLLAACFPGGSITGAPKRRAMQIIDELEPQARDIYCGTVFWMTADGQFGSNIAIRTFVTHAGRIQGWAGAGIVADSVPAAEYQECLDKLVPLMRALEGAFL